MKEEKLTNWKRTPKHILRLDCLRYATKSFLPGRFVEMGAGTGDFTEEFVRAGFTGICFDIGEESKQILSNRFKHTNGAVQVADSINEIRSLSEKFDYLFAFEVLEHIPDDHEALQEWAKLIKPGGKALITVPAHMRKFGPDDEFVGHIRRYEKAELQALLAASGFSNIKIFNYGFPLGNIGRQIAKYLLRNHSKKKPGINEPSSIERSIESGVKRLPITSALSFLFNRITLLPFIFAQRLFFNLDIGDGYVAIATKIQT